MRLKPSYPRLNRSHPLAQGLVGAWAFADGGGNRLTDFSDYRYHGTLTNAPTWSGGQSGHALSFDGTDDYVELGTKFYQIKGQTFTDSVWFRSTDPSGRAGVQQIFDHGNRLSLGLGSPGATVSPGVIGAEYFDGAFRGLSSGITPNVNTWYQITFVTQQGVGHWLYVNGLLVASDARTSSISYNTSREVRIGGNYSQGGTYFGLISSVKSWSRALSAAEVAAIYADPWAIYRPSPSLKSVLFTSSPSTGRLINGGLVNSGLVNRGLVG